MAGRTLPCEKRWTRTSGFVALLGNVNDSAFAISSLIAAAEGGDESARESLFAALYAELHHMARRAAGAERRHRGAWCHDAAPRGVCRDGHARGARVPDRARFMGYAARVMRGVLIDHARERHAVKRGGGFVLTTLDTSADAGAQQVDHEWLLDRWRALSPHLDRALDLDDDRERAAWLASVREQDAALAADLERLIGELDGLRDGRFRFLDESSTPYPLSDSMPGATVGAYTLLSPIGRGGMGTVWLAERADGRFDRPRLRSLQARGPHPRAACASAHRAVARRGRVGGSTYPLRQVRRGAEARQRRRYRTCTRRSPESSARADRRSGPRRWRRSGKRCGINGIASCRTTRTSRRTSRRRERHQAGEVAGEP